MASVVSPRVLSAGGDGDMTTFTFYPLEKPPVGVPAERLKRLHLIRHAQGEYAERCPELRSGPFRRFPRGWRSVCTTIPPARDK